ncbi:MAG: hypothetical protein FWE10_00235 [Rikenellaceae bacterium]|nr:hypothetical protein [Rikenellaceae bacterium]MCL2692168.1 hypothetical protein [Rikenellaceae bacterium]
MTHPNDNDYRNIADRLLEAIGDSEFFNGTVEYETPEYDAQLRVTLIIYREPLFDPADPVHRAERISAIVPVWWEYRLYDHFGEQPNDFSWREFKKHLI